MAAVLRRITFVPAAALLLAAGACSEGGEASFVPAAPGADVVHDASRNNVAEAGFGVAPEAQLPSALDPMLIRTGDARIEVDSIEPAVQRLQGMASAAGGMVASSSITTGNRRYREATLTLKVPAARFDEIVGGLRPLGRIEAVNVSTVDVAEEVIDLTARLEAARRLEDRLLEILRTRTGDLEDVLAVERELARVRTEIERFEGRLRHLQGRVELSHLTVTVHEPLPLVAGAPGENVIARAVRQAWRNLVATLSAIIAALGFLLPLSVVVVTGAWGIRRLRRRHVAA